MPRSKLGYELKAFEFQFDERVVANSVPVGEIASLTSIRGIAAVWVVALHGSGILFSIVPEGSFLGPLFDAGIMAVPLFFILSGYVIGVRYMECFKVIKYSEIIKFLWLRLGRIYPLHFVTLIVSLLLVTRRGWPEDEGHSVASFWENCVLIHAWNWDFKLTWNYPSWSISSEWFAYLFFPMLAFGFSRTGPKVAWIMVLASCVVSVAVYSIEGMLPFKGLMVVIPTFIGGVALSTRITPQNNLPAAILGVLLMVVMLTLPFMMHSGVVMKAAYLIIFFILVAALACGGDRLNLIWGFKPLVYLGTISYSLYLTHVISLTLLTRFLPLNFAGEHLFQRISVVALLSAAVFFVAVICHYVIEKPMRNFSRYFVSK